MQIRWLHLDGILCYFPIGLFWIIVGVYCLISEGGLADASCSAHIASFLAAFGLTSLVGGLGFTSLGVLALVSRLWVACAWDPEHAERAKATFETFAWPFGFLTLFSILIGSVVYVLGMFWTYSGDCRQRANTLYVASVITLSTTWSCTCWWCCCCLPCYTVCRGGCWLLFSAGRKKRYSHLQEENFDPFNQYAVPIQAANEWSPPASPRKGSGSSRKLSNSGRHDGSFGYGGKVPSSHAHEFSPPSSPKKPSNSFGGI